MDKLDCIKIKNYASEDFKKMKKQGKEWKIIVVTTPKTYSS